MTYIPSSNWHNVVGSSTRHCRCGTWKQHWINFSGKLWPISCTVFGCYNPATLGAHIQNDQVNGERIVPMCASCNGKGLPFSLKFDTTLVKANQGLTCNR
jgi:hypothetical protein